MKTFLTRNLLLLSLTSLLNDVSSEMIYPLLPFFLVSHLGASPGHIGLIEGIAESLASLLKVFSGYWSDLLQNRKSPAIFGYAASTLGKAAFYVATSWGWVLAGRIGDKFGKGIRTAPRDALIAESIPTDQRGHGFGFHRLMDTIGAAGGVVIAYLFLAQSPSNYRAVFLWSLMPATLGILILSGVSEPKVHAVRHNPPPFHPVKTWRSLPKQLKLFLLVIFLFALGNSSNAFLLLRAESLGFSPQTVILLYLVYNVVYAAGSYPAGKLSDRVGRRRLIVGGYAAYGFTYLGFAILDAPLAIWGLFGFYGLFSAMTEGVEKALVTDLAPRETRATLLGLYATLIGLGLLPASWIAGLLWEHLGATAPFYLAGFLGLMAAVLMWRVLD